MSEARMGARVMYCGHAGWFVADVHRVGDCNVVFAAEPVRAETLVRGQDGLATHHIVDFPAPCFWKPHIGVFVVPEIQVEELRARVPA